MSISLLVGGLAGIVVILLFIVVIMTLCRKESKTLVDVVVQLSKNIKFQFSTYNPIKAFNLSLDNKRDTYQQVLPNESNTSLTDHPPRIDHG